MPTLSKKIMEKIGPLGISSRSLCGSPVRSFALRLSSLIFCADQRHETSQRQGKFPCLLRPLSRGLRPWAKTQTANEKATDRGAADVIFLFTFARNLVLVWVNTKLSRSSQDAWAQLFGFPFCWTDVPDLATVNLRD